jgi:hypothetical protein
MTTFYLKSPNKKLPIIEALEMMLSEEDSIIEVKEINILDTLTKEDYDRAFKMSASKPKPQSLLKYL